MADRVKYISVVRPSAAGGPVRGVYAQSKREIGMLVEAVTVFSAEPALLTASWAAFREPLLAAGGASRVSKEAVAATVSRLNECAYCVDAHTIMLYGGGAANLAGQLLGGVDAGGLDAEHADLCRWAKASSAAATAPAAPPFPAAQAAEYLGVLVYFHFLNRVINVLLDGTFLPGSPRARRIARRVGGRLMARNVAARNAPGSAVGLVAAPPSLSADLAWATPSPGIAAAFAMLGDAAEAAAARALSRRVAALVEVAVAGWRGERFGPSAAWANGYLAGVPDQDRPAARLALLTAFAPFQVSEQDVSAYRATHPSDRELLGLVAWSSFCAARRVGEWTAAAMGLVRT
jgi:AhpD family alkylhydroperoxidase